MVLCWHITLRSFMGRTTAVVVCGEQLLNLPFPLGLLCTEGKSDSRSKVQSQGTTPDTFALNFWTPKVSLIIHKSQSNHRDKAITLLFAPPLLLSDPDSWHLSARMESSMTHYCASYGTGWRRDVARPSTWSGWAPVRDTRKLFTISLFFSSF